ncbi:hypothetical protein M4B25_03790 [Klebsiella pneumoniae]|nr:hypothetical protein [Klebsiella pneumoniae]
MSSLGNIPADIRVPLVYIDIDNSQALDAPRRSRAKLSSSASRVRPAPLPP